MPNYLVLVACISNANNWVSFSVALDFIHGIITLQQLFPIIPFNIQADGNNHSNCIFHTLMFS